jgi:hypothetical protein
MNDAGRAQQMNLTDDECYELFILVDNEARRLRGKDEPMNKLRELLLPFYSTWHAAHPFKVHPSTERVAALAHSAKP